MKFSAEREALMVALQAVIGAVERRSTQPILANVLVRATDGGVSLTTSDAEVELIAQTAISASESGEVTVPARKWLDIVRSLPESANVSVALEGERATLRSGRSRFTLATLPGADFPLVGGIAPQRSVDVPQAALKDLFSRTHFAMAQQDVRYYLNGMLLEVEGGLFRAVATDGHRLALAEVRVPGDGDAYQVILPRKGVLEMQRLLGGEGSVRLTFGGSHVRAEVDSVQLTSKLIDGRFPEYSRVIPSNPTLIVRTGREALRGALQRTAILSNDKYRGIRVRLSESLLVVQAHNPEQEEAEEELEVSYAGENLEIGFNVTYLLDALAVIDGSEVELAFTDANSSCLIRDPEKPNARYIVMPMRL